jgi:hypothetical protein
MQSTSSSGIVPGWPNIVKAHLHDTISCIRLSFWRMKTSANATLLLIRWWRNLKCDVCTRVYSITYARVRIVYN